MTATPIGNAGDITLRALAVLKGVAAVAAEDTRVTGKLFGMYGFKTKLISYRAENADRATPVILARLARGEAVAIVTDAGTPHVSDPGAALVAAVAAAGHKVFAIPGPSALTAALSISGLSAKRTLFAGFLAPTSSARQKELAEVKAVEAALVFFEAPHRIVEALEDMLSVLGDRDAVICREMTKHFEEVRRGTLSTLVDAARADTDLQRGEIVLVVAPPVPVDAETAERDLDGALRKALTTMRVKDAADAVAGALGLPRRAVYARALELKEDA
ncbi:Ribosomal RNA small subunit methyltransferase I [Alphaproteobacteria bacterium SO-S41]|nr:Ribosomal RNA small subunit methyltransferase I [Alphaproteobacteria bacterium SO-S41]